MPDDRALNAPRGTARWRSGYTETHILRVEAMSAAIEKAVGCEYCGQPAGKRCTTFSGGYAWTPHEKRRLAWRDTIGPHPELAMKLLEWLHTQWRDMPAVDLYAILERRLEDELIHAREHAGQSREGDAGPPDGSDSDRGQ